MFDARMTCAAAGMATVLVCGTGGARAAALPDGIRAMVANALESGDPAVLAAVVAVAKQTAPEQAAEIDELARGGDAAPVRRLEARAATASPAPTPPSPAAEWKGSVELGGSHSSGSTDASAAHGGLDLSRSSAAWTHRITARAEYQDTEGVTNREQLTAAYQPQIRFRPGFYAYGLGQYEHDSVTGFRNRYSLGVGVGVNLADQPAFKAALDVGPALRRTEYFEDKVAEDALAGRAGLNLKWLPTDRITIGQETAFYLDGGKNTVKSLTALDTVLFGPLKGRVSYDVQREQGGAAVDPSTDTTTRASLIYSF